MSTPDLDIALDEDELQFPAAAAPVDSAARPTWAVRLSLAGAFFVAVGVAVVLGALVADLRANNDVLCAGVTLAVAGGVLRSIASPVDRRRNGVAGSSIDE